VAGRVIAPLRSYEESSAMNTIIVADDEEHLRLLVSKTLEGDQHRVLEAADGVAALELAREESPQLLILDWMMPGLSGVEVLEALREDPATAATPVIMLTARSQKIDRHFALMLGLRGYLVKPFSPLELIQLVERVLESPEKVFA
jgi:two-component system alkaline phosphatase synthesis response regulator PhoP